MALPAWDESGLLPSGAHGADLPDIYGRFVLDAPGRDHRELPSRTSYSGGPGFMQSATRR
jgi:hypothetical protein